MTYNGSEWMPLGKMIDEKVVVNGIVALGDRWIYQPHYASGGHGTCRWYSDQLG